jgi:cell division protein FtsI (penicillin-binding protein 3)
VKSGPSELKVARRHLLLVAIAIPLVLALAGFYLRQNSFAAWPELPTEPVLRGSVLAADGTILAEGPSDARTYPQGPLASHLVGFSGSVQPDGQYGLEGIEYYLDSVLATGANVATTLDPVLQAAAEAHLNATAREVQALSGAVVMLETGSGRVLAAASYPSYDPNSQGNFPRSHLLNRAFGFMYEPGSVMKPLVIAALLEDGRLAPGELVPAEMQLRVGNKTFRDIARHGPELTVPDVLAYSSNTAMLHLSERFSPQELYAWLDAFGFGREPDLVSAYSEAGLLNWWERWVPQDHASVTIGQSVAVTPLQLATAYSILANDGVLIAPTLTPYDRTEPPTRVLTPEVAQAMRTMLQHTVESGSLSATAIPGVTVGGKTGTGDVFDDLAGHYIEDEYNLTFAGMFPVDRPRVTMVVMLHRPQVEGSSSTYVAAPLFRRIGSEIVAHWGVSPQPNHRADR